MQPLPRTASSPLTRRRRSASSAPRPAPIGVIGSFLSVPAGQTLSLVAGDIAAVISQFLAAPSGRVNLASVASGGEVSLNPTGITTSGVTQFGTITLNTSVIVVDNVSGMPSGSVAIRGGQLVVDSGSWIRARNTHATTGGDLQFNIEGAMSVDGLHRKRDDLGAGGGSASMHPGLCRRARLSVTATADRFSPMTARGLTGSQGGNIRHHRFHRSRQDCGRRFRPAQRHFELSSTAPATPA